jgi:hypothetical protein
MAHLYLGHWPLEGSAPLCPAIILSRPMDEGAGRRAGWQPGRRARHPAWQALIVLHLHEHLHFCMHDFRWRGPQALKLLIKGSDRGVGGRAEEIRAVPLQAHRGEQGGEIRARKDSPRASGPGCVHRVARVVEQHPEAIDHLPEGAGREAYFS